MPRVPAAVWRTRPDLIVALDDRFGEPVDAYVNGSQVWLRDDGPLQHSGPEPARMVLEWRLHPVAGYQRPARVGTHEVFAATALALAVGQPPPAPPERLWDGLEVFPAYDDEIEPQPLVDAAVAAIGIEPDAWGLVDHEAIADEWERTGRAVSIVDALFAQLGAGGVGPGKSGQ